MKTLTIDEAADRMNIAPGKASTRGRLYKRLIALGYGRDCTRCDGSGSWMGGVCWGRLGLRFMVTKAALSDVVITEARARQDAGELAEYFAECKRSKAARGF